MSTSSNDRAGLCTFAFDDGRHCNMPHTQNELRLCFFHEKREMQRLKARDAGLQISRYLATNLHTACDLNSALVMLFRASAQGYLDSKMVNSLTRLGQLLLETQSLAKEEYLAAYHTDWNDIVQQSVSLRPAPDPHPHQKHQPAPPPAQQPAADTHDAPAGLSRHPSQQEPPAPEPATTPQQPCPPSPSAKTPDHNHPDDPEDDPSQPDAPSHHPQPLPAHHELSRYARYRQRHNNHHPDQPTANPYSATPYRMSRFRAARVTAFRMSTFSKIHRQHNQQQNKTT